ncbi:NlpC/P60 family protein [Amphibacillus jilinensis]|uniref:C40 family peptidase n=1 Tax=Amphibacillus jilinensis TaxID=1216008 RepID=UPI0002EE311F|nr:NlpC/P60 family protein [Amphibacillus jilinensis]
MLAQADITHLVKQSVAYGYIASQPFTFYVDAYPLLQNQWLITEKEEFIAFGDHSPTIRIIQQKLNNLNYFDETIDGEFGLFTEYALKKFQIDHNIDSNGALNTETLESIMKAERRHYLDQLTAIDHPLQYGEKSEEIKALQKALSYFGYYSDELDSIYGPITEEALLQAQRAFGLPETPHVTTEFVNNMEEETEIQVLETPNDQQEEEKEDVAQSIEKDQTNTQVESIIQTAKSQIGSRYQWGGTSPSGFDCSGFIQFAFDQHDVTLPRTVSDMWHRTIKVDQPSIGDLVFFETYKKGPSHAGIYLGNNQFIHASESQGVSITELTKEYWQSRYLGSRRVSLN